MNASQPPLPPRRRTSAIAWLLLVLLLPLGLALGWRAWQAEAQTRRTALAEDRARMETLEQRVAGLREAQRGHAARLQQADATNRLLRDELLAIGQRAALLEESVQRLADPAEDAGRALRLDEAELLLALGGQRLRLAGDLEGARGAYAMAAALLDALDAPSDIDLRQVLAQERAALEALGADPRVAAIAGIDALEAAVARLPQHPAAPADGTAPADRPGSAASWWRDAAARIGSRILQVRRSDEQFLPDASERAAGLAALRLELALARTAAERRDTAGYASALARARDWLPRLWPGSPERSARLAELEAVAALPLTLELPTLGTTLELLRQQRMRRGSVPSPAPRVTIQEGPARD